MTKECKQCLLNTNDEKNIQFNNNGVCEYCISYMEIEKKHLEFLKNRDENLKQLISQIKTSKKGTYDCIIGLSGGTDSSYLAYLVKQWGLNPLVVHFDNGWNSSLSVKNINHIITKLNFDLYTYVVDWNEFKDLQRSFIKADVVDIELLTDHAIGALLYQMAYKHKIKYILSGESTFTEGLLPQSWVHSKSDYMNIKDIQKKFGISKIKSLPHLSFCKNLFFRKFSNIKLIKPLDYIDYQKENAQQILINELGWQDYGGKHNESTFTKFYQTYILPKKFNIDKRKAHYSTLIRAKQISKVEAMIKLNNETINEAELTKDKSYVVKKLGFTMEEFDLMMLRPRKEHTDYRSIVNFYKFASKIKRLIIKRK